MPRMPSRVFACVLAEDSGRMTAGEIAERLQVRPAAVSGAVRYLVQVRLLSRGREPGARSDHYCLSDDDPGTRRSPTAPSCSSRWETSAAQGAEVLGEERAAGPAPARDRRVLRVPGRRDARDPGAVACAPANVNCGWVGSGARWCGTPRPTRVACLTQRGCRTCASSPSMTARRGHRRAAPARPRRPRRRRGARPRSSPMPPSSAAQAPPPARRPRRSGCARPAPRRRDPHAPVAGRDRRARRRRGHHRGPRARGDERRGRRDGVILRVGRRLDGLVGAAVQQALGLAEVGRDDVRARRPARRQRRSAGVDDQRGRRGAPAATSRA